MKIVTLAAAALVLGAGLSGGSTAARAGDDGYDHVDETTTVVTRRIVVERPVERIVREEVVERPLAYPQRRIVREIVEERPVIHAPRPVLREVVIERRGYDRPSAYGPRRAGFVEDGPGFDPDE